MARARNIKPGFFQNEALPLLEPFGRLLFIGLWTLADRQGRLEDKPRKIKAMLFPYDDVDVDRYLNELQNLGFIVRYSIDENQYIQVVKFQKHQSPHKNEAPSTIPAPDNSSNGQKEHHTNRADSLIPDSLIPNNPPYIPPPYRR